MKQLIIILTFWGLIASAYGQDTYRIYLKDKGDATLRFDPYTFFDPKAIERRECEGIALTATDDLPIADTYLRQIESCAEQIIGKSRWFNLVVVRISEHRLEELAHLPFVERIEKNPSTTMQLCMKSNESVHPDKARFAEYQFRRLQGGLFHEKNLTGKGVRVAVLDVGFEGTENAPELAHLFSRKQILDQKDFVTKRTFEWKGGWHGTAVLSCIAGKYQEQYLGLAPDAEFLLARTEYEKREPFVEEIFWTEAAEWADQKGAHIINSSLGYGDTRYTYKDMDGKTSLVARSANKAASKGILVIVAQGNEGSDAWQFLGTPADADSVLSIGGTNPFTDHKIDFSSWGPTYDHRLKPNISAPGVTTVRTDNNVSVQNGTSFATPLVSGFAACVKQLRPQATERQLFTEMQKSGHLHPYFDYAHGYGIPQASYFLNPVQRKPTFQFDVQGEQILVRLNAKPNPDETKNLYYAIENDKGILEQFSVLQAESEIVLVLEKYVLVNSNYKLRVHYEGYTQTYSRQD